MSNVMVAPEFVRQAAGQLQNIGSSLTEANAAASTPTTAVLAPASDEVSAAITALREPTLSSSRPSVPRRRSFIASSWAC